MTGSVLIPETDEVLDILRTALVTLLPPEDLAQVDIAAIGADTQLLSLPIDSVLLMALMNEIEEVFTVFIPEEQAFAFTTAGDLAEFVRQRLTDKAQRLAAS